jgi:serine phosphatase RsbU (regulator of sigma subunit)
VLFAKNDRYPKGLECFERALKIKESLGDKNGMANNLANIGMTLFKEKKYPEALVYEMRGAEMARTYKGKNTEMQAEEILYKTFKGMGKTNEALTHYEKYILLKDTLFAEARQKEVVRKEMNYIYEKKEAELKIKSEAQEVVAAEGKKRQQFVIYGVVGVLLIVIVFSVFLFRRFKITQKQKRIIEQQKHIVEESQREIIDSINYAKRIQYSLLATDSMLKKHLPDYFVLFSPKDIVSGDFYWAAEYKDSFYLAVCDSTGHGVPGAFMSILNIGFLSEAVKEKDITKPNEILNYVRARLIETISKEGQQDGMDCILIKIKRTENLVDVEYAAANNEPVLLRDGRMNELAKDKMPVGKGEKTDGFTLHTLQLRKGDSLILYTDGYADQFGGPKGKKFKYKPLNELLLANQYKPCQEQKEVLVSAFVDWKGELQQVDDVTVIGIRI